MKKALKRVPKEQIIWHQIKCDLQTAKKRVLKRNAVSHTDLFIDENCFNTNLKNYQEITDSEKLTVVYHGIEK